MGIKNPAITGNGIEVEGAKKLCEALGVNSAVKELYLSSQKEGKRRGSRKEREKMTDNKIGDEGAKALIEGLKVNSTLTTLDLGSEGERKEKEEKEKEERRKNDREWDWS